MSEQESYVSISQKLRSESKTTPEFEVMLSGLTLEEIIGLKLELATRAAAGKLFGLKVWQTIPNIAKDSVLRYVHAAAKTKDEAAAFLGIDKSNYRKLLKKFNVEEYFKINID
tara:strand:- start:641 stop:979 length:339 start_codon:yes stop_codon:yes gene_type:complete